MSDLRQWHRFFQESSKQDEHASMSHYAGEFVLIQGRFDKDIITYGDYTFQTADYVGIAFDSIQFQQNGVSSMADLQFQTYFDTRQFQSEDGHPDLKFFVARAIRPYEEPQVVRGRFPVSPLNRPIIL